MLLCKAWNNWTRDANRRVPASTVVHRAMPKWITQHLSKRAPARMLPNEVLDLILRYCSRASLSNCCRVDRNLYSIAVTYLYEDPFALDRVDYPNEVCSAPELRRRKRNLLRTLEGSNHLAKLVRVFRSLFWAFTLVDYEMTMRVLPHLKNLATFALRGIRSAITFHEALSILATLHIYSPCTQHITVEIWPENGRLSKGNDMEMTRVLSAFSHLQDIDIAAHRDLDAEPPLGMVQTIATTCPELRFVNWRPRSYHIGGSVCTPQVAHRLCRYALVSDVWETIQATEIELGG